MILHIETISVIKHVPTGAQNTNSCLNIGYHSGPIMCFPLGNFPSKALGIFDCFSKKTCLNEKHVVLQVTSDQIIQMVSLFWNLMHKLLGNTPDVDACATKSPRRPNGRGSDEICYCNLQGGQKHFSSTLSISSLVENSHLDPTRSCLLRTSKPTRSSSYNKKIKVVFPSSLSHDVSLVCDSVPGPQFVLLSIEILC